MTVQNFKKVTVASLAAFCILLAACSGTVTLPTSPLLLSFDSFEELCASVGYQMVRFDGAYTPIAYNSIEGVMGQITYRVGNSQLQLRMEPGAEGDITGVGQVAYQTNDINGLDVHIGSFHDIQAAWFIYDDFSYSLTATNMNAEIFAGTVTLLAQALTAS